MNDKTSQEVASTQVEIQALAVAAQILDLLAEQGREVSVAEIARVLDMTPPRAWRYINSLEALGMVETRGRGRGYSLGWKLIQLGFRAAERANLNEVAFGPLATLRDTLRETVYLAVPYADGASVVMSLHGGDGTQVSLHVAPGAYFRAHSTASGRVLLAFSSEERIRQVLSQKLSSEGPDPITDPRKLERRLRQIRERFYDTAETEGARRTTGTVFAHGLSVPVFDHTRRAVAVVGILTGIRGVEAITADHILKPVQQCAAQISRALGSTIWDSRLGAGEH